MALTLNDYRVAAKRFGLVGTMKIFASRKALAPCLPSKTFRLRPSGCAHPITVRHGTSDKYVAIEALAHRQYSHLLSLRDVKTVIDAGANIGTATVFLLNSVPQCRVLALEPDPGNFAVLLENLAPYGPRAQALQMALWGSETPLVIARVGFRDGAEWSTQVAEPGEDGVAEVDGATIASLCRKYDTGVIDILKIDIEGAERDVFASIDQATLRTARTIAGELHDTQARLAFQNAIALFGSPTMQIGEVTY